eukprot:CCRYP_000514-RA/>CCRYP_000514-RA protein AED:0.67 eAED:0.21 QI:0/0/0/1/1/1/2/0/241
MTQPESSLATTKESMNQVFANQSKEDSIYPLTTREIAEAQQEDDSLLDKSYSTQLVENIKVLCKDGKMVIPKSLQHCAVAWFHHYLQHPGTKRLEETLHLSMYWKGLRTTVLSHVKKCHSCQVNKRRQLKYRKLPTKLAITNPHFETLCDSYGLKRKPTSVRNPQANAILERVHQTIMAMLRTAELDMADTVSKSDIADFLTNAAWAVRSTYHTVLKTSPGAAIFGRDMLFDVPYIADWGI